MASPCTTAQPYVRARGAYSALQRERLVADCKAYLPHALEGFPGVAEFAPVPASAKDADAVKALFPQTYDTPRVEFTSGSSAPSATVAPVKVGVVLSGGQAPGGHNVIAGIFDGIKRWHKDSVMIGFLDGPHGIFTGNFVEITAEIMDGFRNTGGFDMLGSGRHKIESEEQFKDSIAVCTGIGLDGLVVIGGDDSNTNGAVLAEYFKANGCKTKVVGAPKTIDGDLKCPPYIPISFGFDTACRTYATLVGNVAVDALSAQKYYHLVRLMGRSASNIALEVALLTKPNVCLIGEEVSEKKLSLRDLTVDLADMVEERSKAGKDYGVMILPEGLIEFIPEFNDLISEINEMLSAPGAEATEDAIVKVLSDKNKASFEYLPKFIRQQLLLDRDPHGNVQVAKIETEKLLAATIAAELDARKAKGSYMGSFTPQFHSYGYEGRAGMPTIFDSSYCYALGATAASLLANGRTGVIASVKNLLAPVAEWQCGGVPITSLCVIERRKGKDKPVIRKALVELDGPMAQPFNAWASIRTELRLADDYQVPGPIQYDMANCKYAKDVPITLQLELGSTVTSLSITATEPKKMNRFLYNPLKRNARSELQQWRSARIGRRESKPALFKEFNLHAVSVQQAEMTMLDEDAAADVLRCFARAPGPVLEVLSSNEKGTVATQRIGVVFSGRQAPGCHDLLCGLVDMCSRSDGTTAGAAANKVFGFVGGTQGMFERQSVELTPEVCESYAGTGGLDLLGRTVDRIKSQDELDKALAACTELGLTGLVLVGGARTNTDAAYLAEHFKQKGSSTSIVGIPCGIEGSMVNEFVEASLGFDTASKAMASLVGNTAIDGSSARKYYYFLRMMDGSNHSGRLPTSHVALEVALQTRPNLLLLAEEVDERRMSLRDVVNEIADTVAKRAADGKNFGTVIIAEGLLAAIPEFRTLLSEFEALPIGGLKVDVLPMLTTWSRALFEILPEFIQNQLFLERQSNAAVQLSQLETERLLAALVEEELGSRKRRGIYKGSFSPVCQFLGYQARCSMPSDFDANYAYALGGTAAAVVASGHSGYMAVVSKLAKPVEEWNCSAVPFTALMQLPRVSNSGERPTIFERSVDVRGNAFKIWQQARSACAAGELYENPGPIQLSGPAASFLSATIATRFSYVQELQNLRDSLAAVQSRCRPGCDPRKVRVAAESLATLNSILDELTGPLAAPK